jgi:hypothetical protein
MAIPILDASGDFLARHLQHTTRQVDDCIDHAMTDSVYDPDNIVAQAGGIVAYINSLGVEEVES